MEKIPTDVNPLLVAWNPSGLGGLITHPKSILPSPS